MEKRDREEEISMISRVSHPSMIENSVSLNIPNLNQSTTIATETEKDDGHAYGAKKKKSGTKSR